MVPADLSPASFEALLSPILDRAYRYAVSLTHNEANAQDLVQDAALRAFRAFATFQAGTNFKAWFFKILTNRHFETLRAARRRPAPALDTDLDDSNGFYLCCRGMEMGLLNQPNPAQVLMNKLTVEQVMRAVQALPEEYRVVASLFFLEEMSYQEIGDMLNCHPGTVRSRLHRGRKMLQKSLWTIARDDGIVEELQGSLA